ncbi:MAG: hypothetical protein A4E55_01390 [Pelotomaculum sp. PtaU1.Bin035]|nr:MAG: hypothetical protein A4E55_01390 [Pelotomaculum sp. PtaU1.Bin035]
MPLAFTQGFNPHPKISFAAPLGVGIAGEAEYADFELTLDVPVDELFRALSGALPEGLQLTGIRSIHDHSPALMASVDRATYRAEVKLSRPIGQEELDDVIASFMARPEIYVERKNKTGGKRKHDIRPGINVMSGKSENDIMVIEADLKTGSSGNVRLEEVLEAFIKSSHLPVCGRFVLTRTGIFAAKGQEKKTLWE